MRNGRHADGGPGRSTLDGVTLNGNLNVTAASTDYVTVTNGLTLNGTVTLGGANTYDALRFVGTQTLGGSGTVVFASTDTHNAVAAVNSGTTLTIGPNITVEGGSGNIGYSDDWSGNSTESDVSFVNQGTIISNVAGGSINLDGGAWSSSGSIEANNGDSLNLLDSWTNSGTLSISGAGSLNLNGAWSSTGPITAGGRALMVMLNGTVTNTSNNLQPGCRHLECSTTTRSTAAR